MYDQQVKSINEGYANTILELCQLLQEQGVEIEFGMCDRFVWRKQEVDGKTHSVSFDLYMSRAATALKKEIYYLRSLVKVGQAHGSAFSQGVVNHG